MPLVSIGIPEGGERRDDHRLGMICYGTDGSDATWRLPCCSVPLPVLRAPGPACIWRGRRATVHGARGAVDFRCDGETLFGTYSDRNAAPEQIQRATVMAYRALFEAAHSAGYPHVFRIWNYLPEINREIGGLEVYKSFCIGRQHVFDDSPIPAGGAVPAACAIGTAVPGLRLCFMASRRPAVQLSNPRQFEAYDYPPDYGPRSPVFSRAVRVQAAGACRLYLSGTASIVGHATRHESDIDAQVTETLANLQMLLQQFGTDLADLGDEALLTVYLRHPADLEAVRARLSVVLSPEVTCLFLQGEICRRSLLVEIEGIISRPRGAVLPAAYPDFDEKTANCR